VATLYHFPAKTSRRKLVTWSFDELDADKELKERGSQRGGALPRTATEWARTVICVTAPFDLAPLPEQCLCQMQTIPETPENASFLAVAANYNVY
jgi:hypothetical protein